MQPSDDRFLFVRQQTEAHKSSIPSLQTRSQRKFTEIVKAVFAPQPSVLPQRGKKVSREQQLADYFYTHAYKKPKIRQGVAGAPVLVEDFLEEVVGLNSKKRNNTLYYLLGNVGVGKTAFVNYLISKHLPGLSDSGQIWFVRIDIEALSPLQVPTLEQLALLLAQKTLRILQYHPEVVTDGLSQNVVEFATLLRQHENLEPQKSDSNRGQGESLVDAFLRFAAAIREETGRRLFLIIDNIDYICHQNDRGLYEDPDDTGERHFLLGVARFVTHFLKSGRFGKLGANILFVTRFDSYRVLSQIDSTSHLRIAPSDDSQAFSLAPIDWRRALQAREMLLEESARIQDLSAGRRKELDELINVLKHHLRVSDDGHPALSEHIYELTNGALRALMLFFAQYAWIPQAEWEPGQTAIERFVNQCPVGLLTYMLNTKRRFHQFDCDFPNIYLMNLQPRDLESRDHEHPHTYWLKWLVLSVLAEWGQYEPQKLINIFCPKEGGGYGGVLVERFLSFVPINLCQLVKAVFPPKWDGSFVDFS